MKCDYTRLESLLEPIFKEMEQTAYQNSKRVLEAFQRRRVSDSHFNSVTGYGYNDIGRDILDSLFADIFGSEDALVRIQFVNGTHAIACALRACAPTGGYLSLAGEPYDTLRGIMPYKFIPVDSQGRPDFIKIKEALAASFYPAVFIQRSRGYSTRRSLSVSDIKELIDLVKAISPRTLCVVDNCYGEFVEAMEPPMVGADLTAGSLIKNPGGGLAVSGGYIAGKGELVNKAAEALTVPGIGRECGSSMGQNRLLYQGLFTAPHVVLQALKTACFCSLVMQSIGLTVSPLPFEKRFDIIQSICFPSEETLLGFVRGIQRHSPVDSYLLPEPWDMPGYDNLVVMAAGTFVQGASIELSCDAPLRPPYCAYLQGSITYEAGKLGIIGAVESVDAI